MLPLFFLLSIQALAPPQSSCDATAPTCVAYLAHLEYASHAPPDSVWFDLRYIATPEETSAWFSLSTVPERRAFLERFWDSRAVRAAVSSDVRHDEHVRRLERARRWYDRDYRHRLIGALGANAWYATVEPMLKPASRPDSLYPVDLDDRGLVYMRFGEPDRIERCQGTNMRAFEAGEAWIYAGSSRSAARIVFFATRGRAGDVQIVFSPGQTICSEREMRDLRDLVALYDARLYRAALRDVYSDRHTLTEGGSAISQSIYSLMPIGDVSVETALLHDYTATAQDAVFRERLGLRYSEDLTAVYELLAFRSLTDTTQATIVTSAAVPVSALRRSDQSDGQGAFRIRFALSNESYTALVTDTVARFALPHAPPGALAAFHAEADVSPGEYEYALRMEGGDAALGVVVAGDESDPTSAPQRAGAGAASAGRLHVPAFDGPAPSISSLVIGYATSAPNTLTRFGSALSLVPTHVLPPDARAVLYYELYGIEPGARLQTSIEIAPRNDEDDVQVVSFDEEAAHVPGSSVVTATRTLDFSRLEMGVHEVTVRVRVGDDEVARTTFVDLSENR